jgi:hypothetical protein
MGLTASCPMRAGHGTAGASAAAGGFPLLFVADEGVHEKTEKERECGQDENGGKIGLKPGKHGNSSFREIGVWLWVNGKCEWRGSYFCLYGLKSWKSMPRVRMMAAAVQMIPLIPLTLPVKSRPKR